MHIKMGYGVRSGLELLFFDSLVRVIYGFHRGLNKLLAHESVIVTETEEKC